MTTNPARRASAVLKSLDLDIDDLNIICPLCGDSVRGRGLRRRQVSDTDDKWELIFVCPSCGLVSAFSTATLSARQLHAIQGSAWSTKLRQFTRIALSEASVFEAAPKTSHLVAVFVVSLLTWLVLTGSFSPIDVLWGIGVSYIVARVSNQFVRFDLPRWMFSPRRWLYFGDLLLEFTRQIVVQNITLSARVLRPTLPIRPGIVVIPTKLRNEIALTILGSLISLTPDTVTMDIDPPNGLIYVHWIDVKTTDPQEAYRLISAALEERIIRWLE